MLIERNFFLTGILVIFWVFSFCFRLWDVFYKKYGESGQRFYQWTLGLLSLIHVFIAIFSLVEYLFFVSQYNPIIGVSAFILFIVSHSFRYWAIRALGDYHSQHIEIKENHKVIQGGPYRFVRNPYYLAVIVEVLTTPLIFNAYGTFFCVFIFYLPFLILRIFLEEKINKQYLGEEFLDYTKKVPRFIPHW